MENQYEITVSWDEGEGAFIAEVPALNGCAAKGWTRAEAMGNAERAIRDWIRTAEAEGRTIPPPVRTADLHEAAQLAMTARGVRKRSATMICGLPLYDIAIGPNPETGEVRGRARGIVAIGDIATGWLALGGLAKGIVALGGLALGGIVFGGGAIGVVGLGGFAVGLLAALGGFAMGGIAGGGIAIGGVAVGGIAIGYYACGGAAVGKFVLSAAEQSPQALQFFKQWAPWLLDFVNIKR
jgi:predicted RNase H-like HicB family nuclease